MFSECLKAKEQQKDCCFGHISPLVINQVVNLKHRGVSAAILSGNQGIKQSLQAGSLESGEHSLVFATHIDVCKKLDMVGWTIINVSPDRPNI